MINIYGKNNTNYNMNGDATLIPIRADLTITLNGRWQLEVEVPYDKERRYELIEEGAVIICDVGCIRELASTRQRFRIYDYKKGISSVTAIAFPVAMESTHDAPIDNLVISGKTGVQAMAQIQAKTNKYTLYSDITRTGSTSFANTNVNNAIASGSDGCFIDVWGGEIVYDNLKFSVLNRVGNNEQDKHKIIYGKDITDISYEKDDSGLITRIYPISSDGIRLNGSGYVDSPKVSQYPIVHSRYMSAPYKLIEDDIASSTATAQLTRSIKSQITTLASSLSHSVYNTAVASKVEPEYIRKIKADILSAVQSMATATIYNADANKVMQSAIKDGMEWLKDVSKPTWTWHDAGNDAWWYGASESSRAVSEYVYIDRIWRYFGDNAYWQRPKDDDSKKWDWIQESSGYRYGNNEKYYAQKTYVYITMNDQMKEYWFDEDGYWDGSDDTDSSYAWHGSGTSADPWWFGEEGATSEDTNKFLHGGWWFIDGTYYYFDKYGYYDGTTKFENYQWDWVETSNSKWWFGNDANHNFARVYVTNQWLKVGGNWYRFNSDGYAVGDTALENEVIARFTSGMAQLKTLCETLNTQAFNLLYSQMRSYCTKMFNTGIDVPSVTITVNMADLSNTSEYAKYQHLEKVYLGDSVTALDYKHNISAVERIVSITYDCIKKVNAVVEIGVASSSLSDILKTDAGGSVAGGFDTSVIENTLTNHTNELARLDSVKQNKLTAGENITIVNDVISATGGGGSGLEYWDETSEDLSRTVSEEIPNGWTCDEQWKRTSVDMTMVDNSTTRGWSFSQDTPFAICTCQHGESSAEWIGVICITTTNQAFETRTRTIGGKTFYYWGWNGMLPLSNGARWADSDDVIEIGYHGTYEECVDYFINLINIHVGSFLKHTEIGIGDYVIRGGTRYNAQDEYPFTADKEGNIHAKSIDAIEANPSETPSEELTAINVNGKSYAIPDGVEVVANPEGEASLQLEKLQVGDTIYSMPSGGGGGGSTEATVIFNTFISTTGEITLSDDITNYTDLEFYIKSTSDGTTMVYRVNVQEFMREFPNVASPNERTPHFLPTIWSQSGCYSRIIMGTANNKLLVYQGSSQGVDKIIGINYGGGGSGELVEYDYAKFNGTGGITLPYTINADYTIEVEFDTPTYYNDMAVIGNTDGGGGRSHLTMYSSRWYCSVGNGSEGNFVGNTTGRHTFITNKDNSNYFDGNVVTAYNPYSTSNNYQIGARGNSHYLNGKIYHYKISSISTGDTILDLVPAKLLVAGIEIKSGLYDKINKIFYDGNFITEIDND